MAPKRTDYFFFFGVEKVCMVSKDTLYRNMTGFSPGLKRIGSKEEIEGMLKLNGFLL